MKFYYYLVFLCLGHAQIDTVITIDASSYYDWVYFSFNDIQVLDINDPENSLDWDIAFQRKHIKTNSGLSGLGNGGALVDSSMTWIDEWNSIDESVYFDNWVVDDVLNDFYNPITHLFGEGVKNPALNSWGWFDDNYTLNINHYAMHVLAADGQSVVKFWPYSYYSSNGSGGNISFRFTDHLIYDHPCASLSGDVNQDGIVNVVDLVSIVGYVVGDITFNECELNLSDHNVDGIVNVVDIVAIVSIILN